MKINKLLFPSLFVGAGLALVLRALPKGVSTKLTPKHTSYEDIDVYIERQMRRLKIPGASLAIVEGDQIVHLRGFGRARPVGEVPTPQTPFFIGSLTKSFTALAMMQLVEEGKVELDAPVQHYLPWFRVADPQVSAKMTVRHLLNQTSSLPELPGALALADLDDRPDTAERQVRKLSNLKTTHPVGSRCEYSNLNYNILGLIIEAASGERYAEYIQTHIFDPLKMNRSYTSKAAAQRNGLALGYRHWFSLPFPVRDLAVPLGSIASGQLISCTEDMAHYLIAHLNGGRYGDEQILSEAGIHELHHGVQEYIKLGVVRGRYGMGWFDIDLGQIKTYSHGGNVPDFSAFMTLVPEQKAGMVMLLNADPYGLPPILGEVGLNATALLAGQQPAAIKLDFIQWIMRFLTLVPLLQVLGVATTMQRLRRWDRDPAKRPSGGGMWGKTILLPMIPNLAIGAIPVYLRSTGLIRYLNLFNPDLALIARISGGFAGIWAILRSGLILRALRTHRR